LLILGVLALVFAIGITSLMATAGEEGAGAHHAADAAALGGAEAVLDDMPNALIVGFREPRDIPGVLGGSVCLQQGRVEASRLAAANDATLTQYCYNVHTDEVSVSVRMNSTAVSGSPVSADAVAATTFDASACELDPAFVQPTPSPSPSDSESPAPTEPPEPPEPPRPMDTWIDCGFGPIPVKFTPGIGKFHFKDLASALADLEPRLTA
jgi:hypothetical protein